MTCLPTICNSMGIWDISLRIRRDRNVYCTQLKLPSCTAVLMLCTWGMNVSQDGRPLVIWLPNSMHFCSLSIVWIGWEVRRLTCLNCLNSICKIVWLPALVSAFALDVVSCCAVRDPPGQLTSRMHLSNCRITWRNLVEASLSGILNRACLNCLKPLKSRTLRVFTYATDFNLRSLVCPRLRWMKFRQRSNGHLCWRVKFSLLIILTWFGFRLTSLLMNLLRHGVPSLNVWHRCLMHRDSSFSCKRSPWQKQMRSFIPGHWSSSWTKVLFRSYPLTLRYLCLTRTRLQHAPWTFGVLRVRLPLMPRPRVPLFFSPMNCGQAKLMHCQLSWWLASRTPRDFGAGILWQTRFGSHWKEMTSMSRLFWSFGPLSCNLIHCTSLDERFRCSITKPLHLDRWLVLRLAHTSSFDRPLPMLQSKSCWPICLMLNCMVIPDRSQSVGLKPFVNCLCRPMSPWKFWWISLIMAFHRSLVRQSCDLWCVARCSHVIWL